MRILVVNPIWPKLSHDQAANVIIFELLSVLSKQPDTHVGFLKINHFGDPEPTDEDRKGISAMKGEKIEVLEPLTLPKFKKSFSQFKKIFYPTSRDFYPEKAFEYLLIKRVVDYKTDLLFIPASEWVTALCEKAPVVKFAYYSNPDPKQAFSMARFNWRTGQSNFLRWIAQEIACKKLEKIHLNIMQKYEILGNFAANDAQYYVSHGHPNAFYMQNLWIDRFPNWREERKKLEQKEPPIIVGNVGRLSGTANTHGLDLLGREYLPALRAIMNDDPYEIHLFGSGELHPAVAGALQVPEVHLRGFINDIDREIFRSQVFLCINNASDYKVGHTRYLHAWSLGRCVVAHRDASLSMPEIVHGENALLGNSVAEMAGLTKQAIHDPILRAKIGGGGYETFKQYFTAEKVVPKIIDKIKTYFSTHVR